MYQIHLEERNKILKGSAHKRLCALAILEEIARGDGRFFGGTG